MQLTEEQKEYLQKIADTFPEPFSTMAMDAILFDNLEQYNQIKFLLSDR